MHLKVGIIGPESTAKSTLSQQLAEHFHGVYIPEYARTYIESLSRPYTYDDVAHIAHHQIQQLQQLSPSEYQNIGISEYQHQNISAALQVSPLYGGTEGGLFFDTELIITKVWFLHKYGTCPDFLTEALKANPINFYLLCAPDLPFVPDPLRENPHLRDYLFAWYERELQAYGKPYAIIRGVGDERLTAAIQAIKPPNLPTF